MNESSFDVVVRQEEQERRDIQCWVWNSGWDFQKQLYRVSWVRLGRRIFDSPNSCSFPFPIVPKLLHHVFPFHKTRAPFGNLFPAWFLIFHLELPIRPTSPRGTTQTKTPSDLKIPHHRSEETDDTPALERLRRPSALKRHHPLETQLRNRQPSPRPKTAQSQTGRDPPRRHVMP